MSPIITKDLANIEQHLFALPLLLDAMKEFLLGKQDHKVNMNSYAVAKSIAILRKSLFNVESVLRMRHSPYLLCWDELPEEDIEIVRGIHVKDLKAYWADFYYIPKHIVEIIRHFGEEHPDISFKVRRSMKNILKETIEHQMRRASVDTLVFERAHKASAGIFYLWMKKHYPFIELEQGERHRVTMRFPAYRSPLYTRKSNSPVFDGLDQTYLPLQQRNQAFEDEEE